MKCTPYIKYCLVSLVVTVGLNVWAQDRQSMAEQHKAHAQKMAEQKVDDVEGALLKSARHHLQQLGYDPACARAY